MPIDFNISVLVVDDFPQMRRIMMNLLRKIGFKRFTEAENGIAAITKLKLHSENDKFGLVIMDWNMPKMSGIEVVQAMKASSKLKDIPILMVTAEAKLENIKEAARVGVSKFLVKPFTEEQLLAKITELFP
ncbi:MAG: response regulator [SAR324 cluster bacterium]|nr:response regulator [SAR324 cluster bacterium]